MGRFAAHAKRAFSKMIIWAGTFPPDIDEDGYDFLTGQESFHYYTSREDPFFKEEMIKQQNDVVQKTVGKSPQLHWYEGGHRVIQELVGTI
jgi:predicted esterase